MPKEYLACVASEMKAGKKQSVAQKICAIAYYKKHGVTPQQAESRARRKKMDEDKDMLKFFAPFAKTTFAEGGDCVVEGYMTTDALDSQDEEVDLQASFDAADEWKKWGNIREMHGPSAAGVALQVEKHAGKGVYLVADVVDPVAITKVRKGVYKGFSIGGKILAREGNKITKYRMLEVSLVDRPANPDCLLMVAKADYTDVSKTEATRGDSMTEEKPTEEPKPEDKPAEEPKEDTPAEAAADVVSEEAAEKSASSPEMISKAEYEKMKAEHEKAQARITELEKSVEDFRMEKRLKEMLAKAISELQPEVKKRYDEIPKPDQEQMKKNAEEAIKNMSIGELTRRLLKEE